MNKLTLAMLMSATAAAALAVGAVAMTRRAISNRRHPLKGILVKRMGLFKTHVAPENELVERPERRIETRPGIGMYPKPAEMV